MGEVLTAKDEDRDKEVRQILSEQEGGILILDSKDTVIFWDKKARQLLKKENLQEIFKVKLVKNRKIKGFN